MGKLKKFDIVYDNTSAVFYAGQIITGQVIVDLAEGMEMRGIDLEYKGSADVSWTESTSTTDSDGKSDTETTSYTASETYFKHSHNLFGDDDDETSPADESYYEKISSGEYCTRKVLNPGEHVFYFSYTLPERIPSSFEGAHGNVRYYCRAVIDRPWKFNSICKMPFTIVPVLDLNQQSGAREPVTGQSYKHFCCLCCTTGPLSVMARIDRTGYVPGESIVLNAEIDNLSNRKINYSKAFLKSKITYHARGSTNTENREVTEVKRGPIEQGHSDVWNGELIPIPPVAPSFLVGCEIINIDYYVEIAVVPSGAAFRLTVALPVIIGTIPLKQYFSSFLPKLPTAVPAISAEFSPSAPPLPQYPDAPPPSYEECALGQVSICDKEDNEYTYGKLKYAPVYTYYNLSGATPNSV